MNLIIVSSKKLVANYPPPTIPDYLQLSFVVDNVAGNSDMQGADEDIPVIVGASVPTTVAVILAVTGTCCYILAALKRKVYIVVLL